MCIWMNSIKFLKIFPSISEERKSRRNDTPRISTVLTLCVHHPGMRVCRSQHPHRKTELVGKKKQKTERARNVTLLKKNFLNLLVTTINMGAKAFKGKFVDFPRLFLSHLHFLFPNLI